MLVESRHRKVHDTLGWNPQAYPPGTRVMIVGDIFDERRNGLVGIVQDEDPYPYDARFPNRSPYLTLHVENYYMGRMFFNSSLMVPFDGVSVDYCWAGCSRFHWQEGEKCPKGYRVRPSRNNPT